MPLLRENNGKRYRDYPAIRKGLLLKLSANAPHKMMDAGQSVHKTILQFLYELTEPSYQTVFMIVILFP